MHLNCITLQIIISDHPEESKYEIARGYLKVQFCYPCSTIKKYLIGQKIVGQNCRNFGLVLKILTDKVIFNRESIINLNGGGEEMTRTRFSVGYFWRAWEIISSEVVTIERKYGALACDLALRQISNTTTQLEQKFLEKLKRKCQKKIYTQATWCGRTCSFKYISLCLGCRWNQFLSFKIRFSLVPLT